MSTLGKLGNMCGFGFNVEEDRWAYGSEPYAADVIAEAIAACGKAA
jgi:hypothetical protein